MKEKQQEILEILQDAIESTEIAAVIENLPETDRPALFAQYHQIGKDNRDMIVHVMFMPEVIKGEDKTMDCIIQLEIADEIPEDTYPELKLGLSILNYYTARGAFVISPDGNVLTYRNTITFLAEQDVKDILTSILYYIAYELSMAEVWTDTFYDVMEGRMDFDQFAGKIDEYIG